MQPNNLKGMKKTELGLGMPETGREPTGSLPLRALKEIDHES